jgi:aspartate racemase
MHLGLIGGIGPAATEFYYRGLVKAHATVGKTLDLTIVHADTRVLLDNLAIGAAQEQAEIFLKFVERLQAAGADVAVVTSLSGHFCIKQLEAISPIPVINAIPALDRHFASQGFEKVGLLGTRTVLETRLYGGVTSVDIILPLGGDLDATHANYIEMATTGRAGNHHRAFFLEMARKLCTEQGADAVALAGTDLFLVFDGTETAYPVIDCAQVHIDALVSASCKDG